MPSPPYLQNGTRQVRCEHSGRPRRSGAEAKAEGRIVSLRDVQPIVAGVRRDGIAAIVSSVTRRTAWATARKEKVRERSPSTVRAIADVVYLSGKRVASRVAQRATECIASCRQAATAFPPRTSFHCDGRASCESPYVPHLPIRCVCVCVCGPIVHRFPKASTA